MKFKRMNLGSYPFLLPSRTRNANTTIITSSIDETNSFKLSTFEFCPTPFNILRCLCNRRCFCLSCSSNRRVVLLICFFTLLMPLFYKVLQPNRVIRSYTLSDWGVNVSRNISDYVLPLSVTNILEPRYICQDKFFLLIIVCSSIQNFIARQTIRETWANVTEFNYGMFRRLHKHMHGSYLDVSQQRIERYKDYLQIRDNQTVNKVPDYVPIRVLFLLGRSRYESLLDNETSNRVQQESDQYSDIIQENFIDTYNNLTVKSMLALKWIISNNCHEKVSFFMKCDDDTFINIPNLIHFLLGGTVPIYNDSLHLYSAQTSQPLLSTNRLNATHVYLVGYLLCRVQPISNISSKWYMPYSMYPDGYYPNYLSGSGYLMTSDVVSALYYTGLNIPLVYLEDVYVTGLCAEKANFLRHHHPLFSYTRSKKFCTFKGVITQHDMKDDSLYIAYNFVMNISHRCPPPQRYLQRIRLHSVQNCS